MLVSDFKPISSSSSIRPEELTGFLHETSWTYLPEAEGTGKHGVEYFGVATK